MVSFYSSGHLKELFLAGDQLVNGVPCAHGGLITTVVHGNPRVLLAEDGTLLSCRLTQDYGNQKKGQIYPPGSPIKH